MVDPLAQALGDPALPAPARATLRLLREELDADPQAALLSLFFDGDEPRASIAFGEVGSADLVVVLLHGVDTDLSALPGWAAIARRLCADVIRASARRGGSDRVATVAWFGYDSGSHLTALATGHATIGAARLAGDLVRIRHGNPTARLSLVAYSYSSTLLGELILIDGAGPVSQAFSIASAGMTRMAADAVAEAIAERRLAFFATEASSDTTAPLGRLGAHPVDPRDIDGAVVFGADGGTVPGTRGVRGEATEGHASRTAVDEDGEVHRGYFATDGQAYLFVVDQLSRRASRR